MILVKSTIISKVIDCCLGVTVQGILSRRWFMGSQLVL